MTITERIQEIHHKVFGNYLDRENCMLLGQDVQDALFQEDEEYVWDQVSNYLESTCIRLDKKKILNKLRVYFIPLKMLEIEVNVTNKRFYAAVNDLLLNELIKVRKKDGETWLARN